MMQRVVISSIQRRYHRIRQVPHNSRLFSNGRREKTNLKLFSSLPNVIDDDDEYDTVLHQNPKPRLNKLREQLSVDQHLNISDYNIHTNKIQKPSNNQDDENYELPQRVQNILTNLRQNSKESMLTDTYNRVHNYLRISLIEKCNLRCQYCMPEEGTTLQPSSKLLTTSELQNLTKLFIESGVTKVRLTGGEPLLRKDLAEVIEYINTFQTVESIGITTNGITLSRELPKLIQAGLTHVNISLDTLDSSRFQTITRRNGYTKVLQSIKDSMNLLQPNNERRVKVNCVVMKGINDDEIVNFCNLLSEEEKPLDIRFIEWMPFYNNKWNTDRLVNYREMLERIEGYYGTSLTRLEDAPNDTTKWFGLGNPNRRIGFITSMSDHFCNTCNRLRITADGQLKVCLFGEQEINLRALMRQNVDEDDLRLIVEASVKSKYFKLGGFKSGEEIALKNSNRAMTLIGG